VFLQKALHFPKIYFHNVLISNPRQFTGVQVSGNPDFQNANHNTMEVYDGVEVQLRAFLTTNWIT
jgi:hypothetical protein